MQTIIPRTERSGLEDGNTGGRARLFLCGGWEFEVVEEATRGSSSHGDTLSGRMIAEGSSH